MAVHAARARHDAPVPPSARSHRLRAAREAAGLRSLRALVDLLDQRGYSYGKLAKIEAGLADLSPQDASYIADRLGLPHSFFTAPLGRLGDVALGPAAEVRALEDVDAVVDDAIDELDQPSADAPDQEDPEDPQSDQGRRA